MLNFEYELYIVPDGKFGAENQSTHEWNGLVREIIDKVCYSDTSLHTGFHVQSKQRTRMHVTSKLPWKYKIG